MRGRHLCTPLSLAAIYFVLGQKLLFAQLFGVVISTATV